MRTWNKFFLLCLTGTILLTIGVIFLPRHFSRSMDKRTLNWVETAGRNDFSFLEPSNNGVLANERAFRNLTYTGDNLTLVTSIDEPIRMNGDLMDQVYNQAMTAAEYGMFPWIGTQYYKTTTYMDAYSYGYTYDDWAAHAKFAEYYSLTYESEDNPNNTEMLNFWYLRFSDDMDYDYYFIVNAVSYQIYYARIYNKYTDSLISMLDINEQEGTNAEAAGEYVEEAYGGTWANLNGSPYFAEEFSIACAQYYESDGYGFIENQNLHDKLGLTLLYYGSSTIYIEQAAAKKKSGLGYGGIEVGFQEITNKIELLEK